MELEHAPRKTGKHWGERGLGTVDSGKEGDSKNRVERQRKTGGTKHRLRGKKKGKLPTTTTSQERRSSKKQRPLGRVPRQFRGESIFFSIISSGTSGDPQAKE